MRFAIIAGLGGLLAISLWAASTSAPSPEEAAQISPDAMPIALNRGASGLSRYLAALRTRASILMITAHPDDEDGGMLAYQTRGLGARAVLLTLNRGEGGQNAMSTDFYDALGLVRTQELLQADRYYGVEQYWGRVIDYGFSKTREEALEKWNYDRVLSDAVRVVRMSRPLVLTSVFIGAPTDGHGNHQVAGQMTQEAYLAAGDPSRFPEQIREGLRPWKPLKVYARVPFFQPTKDNQIYDYATDKYVPLRFYDYVNKTWIEKTPSADLTIPESIRDAAAGLTFQQIAREGWGQQKSQNGGATVPQPSLYSAPYHRYGSQVPVTGPEHSFYDGVDTSLAGIASLAAGDQTFLTKGLAQVTRLVDAACDRYRVNDPSAIAPVLAEGLQATRGLIGQVEASTLAEPGKDDVAFELRVKAGQFEKALTLALGVSFDAAVAAEKEPTGPAAFAGPQQTFTIAIPGQTFSVQTALVNEGRDRLKIKAVVLGASDGKDWKITGGSEPETNLDAAKDLRRRFAITVPADAAFTKPYFSRPDQEQPYYGLTDERFRNLSLAPYPLWARAVLSFNGVDWLIEKVVQTNHRTEGIGMQEEPLLLAPAISVSVYPAAGAVPLTASAFAFSCTLHSNAKGPAKGMLRLHLPNGWRATPPELAFAFARDGESETFSFQVTPAEIKQERYEIRAVAEYGGKKYAEGYQLVGYPGLRPYPYYRPASYQATGVDVKTAPGLHVAFYPGTGDEVPRALEDLGLRPQVLGPNDLFTADLSAYDAIILGVRAYQVRPELQAAGKRLLEYVKKGGVLIVQYNLQSLDDFGPYPFSLGSNPQKVVDENSAVQVLDRSNPALTWPNTVSEADFKGWQEERGHGFMKDWDHAHYTALFQTQDPEQAPQQGGLLLARYGKGFYVYDAYALYRQLPSGVPGAYRLLANLVSLGKNPKWK